MDQEIRIEPARDFRKASSGSFWGKMARWIGGILVFAGLGALAVGGHRFGWKLPKFSQMTGQHEPIENDWCAEHGVPESQCVECNAALMPRLEYGWCETHGIPNCLLEHPE